MCCRLTSSQTEEKRTAMPEQQMRNVVLRAALEDCCSGLARVVDDVQRLASNLRRWSCARHPSVASVEVQCDCSAPKLVARVPFTNSGRSWARRGAPATLVLSPMPAKGATNVEDGFFPRQALNARRVPTCCSQYSPAIVHESTRV